MLILVRYPIGLGYGALSECFKARVDNKVDNAFTGLCELGSECPGNEYRCFGYPKVDGIRIMAMKILYKCIVFFCRECGIEGCS
jgi:hypothetical protein